MSTAAYGAASCDRIPLSLKVSLAGADQKLAQLDQRSRRAATVSLGLPAFRDIAGRTVTAKDPK